SGLLPLAMAGVLGDFELSGAGFTQLFLVAAGAAVMAGLFGLPLPERRPEIREGRKRGGFISVIRWPSLAPVWLMSGGLAFVLTAYFTFLRTYVDETGIGSVGLFFAVYGSAAVLLRIVFGWVPDRFGPKRVLYPAMGSLAAGFVVLTFATGNSHIALAGLLCGVGHGYAFPILSGLVATRAPDEDRGSAITFFTALLDVGLLIAGPLLGWIITWLGYSAMFSFAAGFIVLATIAFAIWDARMLRAHELSIA
ncbi:MAG: MFS transporter, partial [Acidimicrobiia bacterium]|nr:MFS transporter [Acidimicrobiia bacterium]